MERSIADTYQVRASAFLSSELLSSLTLLYQPLIGPKAYDLYMSMYAMASLEQPVSHKQLFSLVGMNLMEFEKAIVQLESYFLLRTYEKKEGHHYLYCLNPPLTGQVFLTQKEWVTLWINEIGEEHAGSIAYLFQKDIKTHGYDNITHESSVVSQLSAQESEVIFSKPEPRYHFSDREEEINFNYDRFLTITDKLVFPIELRTRENMRLIGTLATVYGLSPDRMNILVSRAVNIEQMTFDRERLSLLAQRSKPDVTTADDIYSLPPVAFLQSKQNGASVTMADRKILENLCVQMKFPTDVVNIMIEYILSISDNRLIKSFVDMVAGEWARDGVDTREKAIAQTKKRTSYQSNKRTTKQMPDYFNTQNQEKQMPNEEELKQIEALMKKMEGGY